MPTLPHASTPERAIEGHGQHSSRIIGLDLVRAAAIAMVLMAHMSALTVGPWPMTWVFSVGGLVGVEVFFALSGFLVGGILYRSVVGGTLSLTHFWRRRWLRTIPAYLVFLTLNTLFAKWFSGAAPPWREIGPYLFYVQNLGWPQPSFFGEAWSLAVEEWFYLLSPVLLLGLARLLPVTRAFLTMACGLVLLPLLFRLVFVATTDPSWDQGVRKIVIYRLDAIGVGVLIAGMFGQGFFAGRRQRVVSAAIGGVLLIGSVLAYWMAAPSGGLDRSYSARTWLFFLCPLGAALTLPWFARVDHLRGRVLPALVRWLAAVSYSAYMCNLLILKCLMVSGRLRSLHPTWQVCVFLAGTLLVATASYLAVERPFMRLARRPDVDGPRDPSHERIARTRCSRRSQ